jgi:hypothetical protein
MVIKGVVGIENKKGEIKEMPYETKIAVNSSNKGSIGLPETAMLYEEWDNKITAAAGQANLKSMTVSVNGRPCAKKGDYYIARVSGAGTKARITVTSKDKNDKTSSFTQEVRVKPLPTPLPTSNKISKSGGKVMMSIGGALQGVSYTVLSVKVNGQTINGGLIPGTALRSYSAGSMVPIEIRWQRVGSSQSGILPYSLVVQ